MRVVSILYVKKESKLVIQKSSPSFKEELLALNTLKL